MKKKEERKLQINAKGGINVILFCRMSLVASDSLAKSNELATTTQRDTGKYNQLFKKP